MDLSENESELAKINRRSFFGTVGAALLGTKAKVRAAAYRIVGKPSPILGAATMLYNKRALEMLQKKFVFHEVSDRVEHVHGRLIKWKRS